MITNNARLDITHNDKVDQIFLLTAKYFPAQDTWTLTLRNVETKDRGPYMCQVNMVAYNVMSHVSLLGFLDFTLHTFATFRLQMF